MAERNIFIDNIPVDVARDKFLARLKRRTQVESLATVKALGRVTVEAVHATVSSPNSNQSAMDGIAVRAADTVSARERSPLDLKEGDDYYLINTGQTVEKGFDAVIMIEDVVMNERGQASIVMPATPWQHIRTIGEDMVATEMIVPSGHRLRPVDMAALLAGGLESVKVRKKPHVAIIPTGHEIVQKAKDVEIGTIRDTNSVMLAGMLTEQGASTSITDVIADDQADLATAITTALRDADMVLVIAGSSAGSKDYTAAVLKDLGEVLVHGVAMKPGKPVVLALVDNKPVIGIPGFPVSAYLACKTFAIPALAMLSGEKTYVQSFEKANAARKIVSSVKSEEYVRVNLGFINDRLVASPLSSGAGLLMSLVRADGIALIPRRSEGVDAGGQLFISALKTMAEIRHKLFVVGSHDLIVDVLSDMMPLSSSHVGSQAGLLALKNKETNLAPTHILDPQTGVYNEAAVRRYFPNDDMILIKGVERIQGFMVAKGNPKNIKSIDDLARQDVSIVNRQRGAGTRILLDYLLHEAGILPDQVDGYDRAMSTHMAVASAVSSDSADVGLGVLSAAKALELDFIRVANEEYDFLIYNSSLNDPRIQTLLACLKSDAFRTRVEVLGGYGFKRTGELVCIDATEKEGSGAK